MGLELYQIVDIAKGDAYYYVKKSLIGICVVRIIHKHETYDNYWQSKNGWSYGKFRIIDFFLPLTLYDTQKTKFNTKNSMLSFYSVRLKQIHAK
jgi:hypothetical protein